ncbi:hypothetical protein [Desulfosudis oleivorans]|uniref:Uncharacterized protein n=1 Tax=Desulfosudis oleivorans (strain DSM 6200 / JCM 39069 / Hxd3) TaxID=96561 RepID=A8ZYB4_DESOH|nr:hypothetical protein [Desulfosudis oleivorans]ABW67121.1 conserved hypothetical protein [Desulfosudis oleivorans Hxd3]
MVQVDVVWAYAFGAGFAACAARQLDKQEKPFTNKWYTFTLLFLSILFAPSGIYLLWQFVQWETMQVATTFTDLPAWLVCGFAVTNITQGILGFYITWLFIRRKNYYAAHANWMWAWILFWFILVCGWDTTGYQRFLYDASVHDGVLWEPGRHMGLAFFWKSNVWWTLVGMAVFFAPMLIYAVINFIPEGARQDPTIPADRLPGPIPLLAASFGAQWVACLGLAIVAALMVMGLRDLTGSILLGYLIGVPLFIVLAQFLLFRRGMPMQKLAKILYIKEPGEA